MIILAWIFVSQVLVGNSYGQDASTESLHFHLDCREQSQDCIELPEWDSGDRMVRLEKAPQMSITKADIKHAEFGQSEFGGGAPRPLQLRLHEESARKLGEITTAHIQRSLVVVANDKVILNAVIMSPITEGNLTISPGASGEENSPFQKISWLNQMAEKEATKTESTQSTKKVVYFALGLLLILGSMVFAFLRDKKD